MIRSRTVVWLAAAALATAGLTACGGDDASTASTAPAVPSSPATTAAAPTTQASTTTTPPTTAAHRTTAPPAPNTTDGGGGMQAGAPRFVSFDVSSSAPCQSGNAEVHMSFSTLNVVDIEIKIGGGSFAETAGYGPNESDVVASIPCNGPGTSSVQLRGCTENRTCVESASQPVEITD